MASPSSPISVDLLRAAVRSESFPKDWSEARRSSALARYERFFTLLAKYPSRPLAPTAEIDEFWHLHMLHPVAYARDCMRLAGHIIDHDGGFGATPDELPRLQAVFAETAAVWKEEFGEAYVEAHDGLTKCDRNCQSRCWHACSSISTS
jgi:hypothetical protein